MSRYRKKPIEVEAIQFFPWKGYPGLNIEGGDNCCYVTTIQGQRVKVSPTEWIITESDGIHYYPCSDEEFKKIYENIDILAENPPTPRDWRLGLTVKPKYRNHELYYETGEVLEVHPEGFGGIASKDGVLKIKMVSGRVILQSADDWITV